MRAAIAMLFVIMLADQARAEACPDFFRFVDFGQKDAKGDIYRGGPTLRAEGFAGQSLILDGATECRDLRDLAVDGRGNPIPVVSLLAYDPAKIGLDLLGLTVSIAEDTAAIADQNAGPHQLALQNSDAAVTRSEDFLCVRDMGLSTLSCQLTSPYPADAHLVVYCAAGQCDMPVLAIDEQLFISATWSQNTDDAPTIGRDIAHVIGQIHAFLAPLSAAF